MIRSETFGLERLAEDLERADEEMVARVKKITSKTLLEMKRHAQGIVAGHQHLPHLGRSFSYDVAATKDKVTGEVGADLRKRQGPLDGIIEDGAVDSAPIPHWRPAADRQVPIWEGHLEDAAVEVIDG